MRNSLAVTSAKMPSIRPSANIRPRYKPIEVKPWDARELPLDENSVNAVVCNLPFGVQISTPEENRRLYPAVMKELRRVMQLQVRGCLRHQRYACHQSRPRAQ
jgi:23S rRNA G2445 N2-methylase RlmL